MIIFAFIFDGLMPIGWSYVGSGNQTMRVVF
jgi:hypothetical protein